MMWIICQLAMCERRLRIGVLLSNPVLPPPCVLVSEFQHGYFSTAVNYYPYCTDDEDNMPLFFALPAYSAIAVWVFDHQSLLSPSLSSR